MITIPSLEGSISGLSNETLLWVISSVTSYRSVFLTYTAARRYSSLRSILLRPGNERKVPMNPRHRASVTVPMCPQCGIGVTLLNVNLSPNDPVLYVHRINYFQSQFNQHYLDFSGSYFSSTAKPNLINRHPCDEFSGIAQSSLLGDIESFGDVYVV